MLEELRISGIGVIDEVTLELADGLNVVTGETGAGKTILVSSLQLLRGGRADGDMVRHGAARGVVEGRFHPVPADAGEWVEQDEEDLLVGREVIADASGARSRARVGGRLAPVSALAQTVGALVEIHAQSDAVKLADPAVQRDLLDRSGGPAVTEARSAYEACFDAWRAASDELAELTASTRDRAREIDRLRFELEEIDAVAPQAGEEERIDAELARLEHAEALIAAAQHAGQLLVADGGGRDALGACLQVLRGVESLDPELDELRVRADGLTAEVQDLGLALTAYAERTDLDPARLEELRERRGLIGQLARKYGPDAEAIGAYADEARQRLSTLEGGQDRLEELEVAVDRCLADAQRAATVLGDRRREAGARLREQVEAHLEDLAMASARFTVELEEIDLGPHGAERVRFLLAANPGESELPLAKAASGGERSRIALAVRLALADADDTSVLVFDEVDAGIGGATATEVGRKLADLAKGRQVLCVTHLAQLAAFADRHFVVEKRAEDGRTVAEVRDLPESERSTELSRMLSGSPDSVMASGHAAELRAAARAHLDGG